MTVITAESSVLARALRDVASIVNKTETLPILSCVLIETIGADHIRITATDTMKRIERTMKADVAEAGAFAVEAARFSSLVSAFEAGSTVKLVAGDALAVTSGRSRLRFGLLSPDQFPRWPAFDVKATITADDKFKAALSATRHAHATSEVQIAMLGAFLNNRNGLEIVGLDGQRMGIVHVGGGEVPPTIVPSGAIDLMLKLSDGDYSVEIGETAIRCDFGMTVMTAKLVDATYPDYTRALPPADMPRRAFVTSDALTSALSRMSLMTDDKERKVRLSFEANRVTLTLDKNAESATEEVSCDYEGEPLTIGYRALFLRDALTALDADDVTLEMIDARGPTRLTAKTRPGTTLVVMPVSI